MIDLDTLIERARSATVNRVAAERYVRKLDRRVRESQRSRRWVPPFAAGLVVAAATALVLLFWRRGDVSGEISTPVAISSRVTIIVEPGTTYLVVPSSSDETLIMVVRGAVTARLWPGPPHRLELAHGHVRAVAIGTVYSLAIRSNGPVVSVMEGTVEVRDLVMEQNVTAGQTWPAGETGADPAAGRALLALSAPPLVSQGGDLGEGERTLRMDDAGIDLKKNYVTAGSVDAADVYDDAVVSDATANVALQSDAGGRPDTRQAASVPQPRPHPAKVVPSIKERWLEVQVLHRKGKLAAAVTQSLAIADAHDPIWSPIALVDAVRTELEQLSAPERAVELADRMIQEWPTNILTPDARELRCSALRQLNRTSECSAPNP